MNDQSLKSILVVGISIMYVVLVFFFVTTVFPSSEKGDLFSNEQDILLIRSGLAMVLGIITMMAAAFSLRDFKELFHGLVAGAGLVLIGSVLFLLPMYGNEDFRVERATLLGVSFLLQMAILFFAERTIPAAVTPMDAVASGPQPAESSQPTDPNEVQSKVSDPPSSEQSKEPTGWHMDSSPDDQPTPSPTKIEAKKEPAADSEEPKKTS